MVNKEVSMTFTPEAMTVFYAVDELLHNALAWAERVGWTELYPDIEPGSPEAYTEYKAMLRRVDEMRESWSRCVIGLIELAASFGSLRVTKDGEYSLYFFQPESGFCGGVILHWDYKDGHRLMVGTWSTNT